MLYYFQEEITPNQGRGYKLFIEVELDSVAADVKNQVNILKEENLNDVIQEGKKQLKSLQVEKEHISSTLISNNCYLNSSCTKS
ncbi:unnamed protein product [Paramecium sonneborni]|uniref:Uncharacterized protein n=1 Tax=Paramecium sonneborni TaxID=65129 RepID=A0A8S1JVI7_9CILI|nr:unnamed protein product [Paramecium sonneborni]CAD8046087.1 unnamed protein product [Paramecium sonneborni]